MNSKHDIKNNGELKRLLRKNAIFLKTALTQNVKTVELQINLWEIYASVWT